jgi:deazaflavin-dependent oxidoreductase (nitroreductase family)
MANALVDRSWPILRRAMAGHTLLYRATNGLVGHRIPGVGQHLLLDHVGAKSGKKRTTPLLYVQDGDDLVIIASKGGNPRHPAWYHNLRANPDTEVQVGSERRKVHARLADDDERPRMWAKAVAQYGGYHGYQQRTSRKIPVVVLERRR